VRPDPGLEVLMTNHENELVVAARRKRDLIPWSELTAAPSAASSAPVPMPKAPPQGDSQGDLPPVPMPAADDGQAAAQTPSIEAEAAAKAKLDPTLIDAQLRRALEHLQRQIEGRPSRQQEKAA
jgi:hypothetical protein